MAGHSKWNNIKNRKGAQDQRKSRAFFDVTKLIRAAVKHSQNPDPNTNPALRLALEKARAVNLPKDKIQRAINRAMGRGESGQTIQEVVYEAYGPHGVGFVVIAATDNVQRTAASMRFIFSRHGGSLSGPGSVMFMFTRSHAADFGTASDIASMSELKPNITIDLSQLAGISDEQKGPVNQIEALIEALSAEDDVEEVYHNAVW